MVDLKISRFFLAVFWTTVIPPCRCTHGNWDKYSGVCITMYKCVLALRHFFLFQPRVFLRALGAVARKEPARTPYASLGPGQGPWHVLWGFKAASSLGEGFRARRAIQAHANPRTKYIVNRLKKCPTSHVISGIMNVINVVRHYMLGDGNVFSRHQHARHATI